MVCIPGILPSSESPHPRDYSTPEFGSGSDLTVGQQAFTNGPTGEYLVSFIEDKPEHLQPKNLQAARFGVKAFLPVL